MIHSSFSRTVTVLLASLFSVAVIAPTALAKISAPVQITYDSSAAGGVSLVQQRNGDLVAIFDSSAQPTGLHASISQDGGLTWSRPFFVNSGWDRSALIENSDGQLVLLANEGLEHTVSISVDGTSWTKVSAVNVMKPNYSIGDLFQDRSGTYFLTYTSSNPEEEHGAYVYVTHSLDLKSWSTPVPVSTAGYSEFGSSIAQKTDGSYVIAYNSYPMHGIMMSTSQDGVSWKKPRLVASIPTNLIFGIRFLTNNGKLSALWNANNNTVMVAPVSGVRLGVPKPLFIGSLFDASVVSMGKGKYGVAFLKESAPNANRNVYFDTLLGRK
jgi:hypothetical protein